MNHLRQGGGTPAGSLGGEARGKSELHLFSGCDYMGGLRIDLEPTSVFPPVMRFFGVTLFQRFYLIFPFH